MTSPKEIKHKRLKVLSQIISDQKEKDTHVSILKLILTEKMTRDWGLGAQTRRDYLTILEVI